MLACLGGRSAILVDIHVADEVVGVVAIVCGILGELHHVAWVGILVVLSRSVGGPDIVVAYVAMGLIYKQFSCHVAIIYCLLDDKVPYARAVVFIVFGIIPYVIFLLNPSLAILGAFGVFNVAAGSGDYLNVFNAITQMPKGARTYLHHFNSCWYMPEQ